MLRQYPRNLWRGQLTEGRETTGAAGPRDPREGIILSSEMRETA
jgi:hypothetical protein